MLQPLCHCGFLLVTEEDVCISSRTVILGMGSCTTSVGFFLFLCAVFFSASLIDQPLDNISVTKLCDHLAKDLVLLCPLLRFYIGNLLLQNTF